MSYSSSNGWPFQASASSSKPEDQQTSNPQQSNNIYRESSFPQHLGQPTVDPQHVSFGSVTSDSIYNFQCWSSDHGNSLMDSTEPHSELPSSSIQHTDNQHNLHLFPDLIPGPASPTFGDIPYRGDPPISNDANMFGAEIDQSSNHDNLFLTSPINTDFSSSDHHGIFDFNSPFHPTLPNLQHDSQHPMPTHSDQMMTDQPDLHDDSKHPLSTHGGHMMQNRQTQLSENDMNIFNRMSRRTAGKQRYVPPPVQASSSSSPPGLTNSSNSATSSAAGPSTAGPSNTRTTNGRPPKPASRKCPDCTKNYQPSEKNAYARCTRCHKKWMRANRGPTEYKLDADMPSFAAARSEIYPILPPLGLPNDDIIPDHPDEETYIQRFLTAANKSYSKGDSNVGMNRTPEEQDGWDSFYTRQQDFYNKKGFLNREVVKRLRMLYHAIRVYHGGGESVYPVGGDNAGYNTKDTTMIFSQRVAVIEHIMRLDKRVVSDVVEGRGVCALVADPWAYERRKTDNETSNRKKKGLHTLGKEQEQKKREGEDEDDDDE